MQNEKRKMKSAKCKMKNFQPIPLAFFPVIRKGEGVTA